MGNFLLSFSDSFLAALIAWPFIAILLTVPIIAIQYRRFNRIRWGRAFGTYLFILYGLGLVSFTLYPMPDNAQLFCQSYDLSPQLIPFTFIHDIQTDGVRAILQVAMNIAFFIPLGVFARLLFRWKFIPSLILIAFTSLCIETAQLTGAFGIYPCSYRLFDVDDLMINTLGGILGYVLASVIPRKELEFAEKGQVNTQPGALRRLITFIIDQFIVSAVLILVTIALYFVIGKESTLDIQPALYWSLLILGQLVMPLATTGRTPASYVTRLSLENKKRTPLMRCLYYVVRAACLLIIIAGPNELSLLFIAIIVIGWLFVRRPLYTLI